MVSGYDKSGPEFTPRHPRRPERERLTIWIAFLAAIAAGAVIGLLLS